MEPRLKPSSKWTSLPKEQLQQIKEAFAEKFKEALQGGAILVEGRIYSEELILCVGYAKSLALKQSNFEVSLQYDKDKQNALKLIYKAVDCIESMMHEYFSHQEKIELPRSWHPLKFEGQEVFVQYSTVNTELEAWANQLLGKSSANGLIQDT